MHRPLKDGIVSTVNGKIIPLNQAMEQLPCKFMIICDNFKGLHPTYRKILAKDTWIIEVEKPKGLRKE